MKIETTRHRDASEPNAQGLHDYVYEYDAITFADGTTSFLVRSYTDEPQRAAFMTRVEAGRSHLLTITDTTHPLFRAAAAWLRANGKTTLTWLDGKTRGYIETKDLT